ncbi:CdaR family protein [Metabacillus malikii]|uniref:YbbR domain-containing protein n=1 Tax=Metabacillus malikii TaxID=1504265 RepID=A0ABT9ZKU0_9BACI|nr:CdaR family protein [Metabacillus malikii]MDQ0232401.1 YbbR domain-containing protein [Metabacillus malikii]
MDRLIENRWVMRIIALFLALMLYASVNIESDSSSNQSQSPFFSSSTTDKATVTEVPVVTYFDQENLVVTGIPEYVKVNLEGDRSALTKARQTKDFEIYADLNNLSIGTHQVRLKYKNIPGNLTATINPSVITVTIEEKVAKDFQVEVDLLNEDKLEEGYTPDQPIVNPNSVRVTASQNIIDQISSVKAVVNLEEGTETINQESRITVYDKDGRILAVEVEPSVVDVTVPIKSPSKSLPFKINREGELGKGLSISSIDPEVKEITVFGPLDVIDELQFIDGLSINLNTITKDTVLEIDVPIPEGANKVTPEKLKINVDVDEQEEKSFKAQSIKPVGLSNGKIIDFIDPDSGKIDITILGASSVIKDIDASDIELYINLSDISDGEHDIDVFVNSPQNITWELQKKKVKVKISSD